MQMNTLPVKVSFLVVKLAALTAAKKPEKFRLEEGSNC